MDSPWQEEKNMLWGWQRYLVSKENIEFWLTWNFPWWCKSTVWAGRGDRSWCTSQSSSPPCSRPTTSWLSAQLAAARVEWLGKRPESRVRRLAVWAGNKEVRSPALLPSRIRPLSSTDDGTFDLDVCSPGTDSIKFLFTCNMSFVMRYYSLRSKIIIDGDKM